MKVALVSTDSSGIGSMDRYAHLVKDSITKFFPEVELSHINIRHQSKGTASRTLQRFELAKGIALSFRRLTVDHSADVYHFLDGSFLYLANSVPMERTVVAVHDLIPLLQTRGELGATKPGFAARRLLALNLSRLKKANFIYTVSQNTAADLSRLSGCGADAIIHNPVIEAPTSTVSSLSTRTHRNFILHVGNNSFYKNRAGVLDIFRRISDRMPDLILVMAGAAPDDNLKSYIQSLELSSKVEFAVNPTDTELQSLYTDASCLIFPSLYEGFGWPPLEAAQFGCPVVCSDAGSLPEIVGQGGVIHCPDDVDAFANSAMQILEDTAFSTMLSDRGRSNLQRFSLHEFATNIRAAYDTAHHRYEESKSRRL